MKVRRKDQSSRVSKLNRRSKSKEEMKARGLVLLLPSLAVAASFQRRLTKQDTSTILRSSSSTPATDTVTMMMKGISPFSCSTELMARALDPGGGSPIKHGQG